MTSLIASFSFVADSVLALVLEDDQVPKICDELQQVMQTEVEYVHGLPYAVIDFIARASAMDTFVLRD